MLRGESGQASVELVGTLPCVVVAALIAWQLVLVGHVAWLTASAARSGARAAAVGHDPGAAARAALPGPLRAGTRVERIGKRVEVHVPVPAVVYRWRLGPRFSAAAELEQ